MNGRRCLLYGPFWNERTFRLSPTYRFRKISLFLSRKMVELMNTLKTTSICGIFWSSRGWVSSVVVQKCHVWNCREDWDISVGFDSYCLLSFSSSLRSSFISSESWCWSVIFRSLSSFSASSPSALTGGGSLMTEVVASSPP